MGKVHGKKTYVRINAVDISQHCNSTTPNRSADSHETTTYGVDDKVYSGGLRTGTIPIGGFYDDSLGTGPAAVIEPLLGTNVPFVWRPEGTGSGKPEKACTVLVTAYNTSLPVGDMVTWTAELQISGPVTTTTQA